MTAVRALITMGLAAFWLLLVAPPMFMTPPSVYTGVHLVQEGTLLQPLRVRIDRNSPAYHAGLRTGDVLGCLSLRDKTLSINPSVGFPQAYAAGTPISTCIKRNGRIEHLSFAAATGAPVANIYGSPLGSFLRVCAFLVFLITGIALVTARPSLLTWTFFIFCLGSAPTYASREVWTILPSWQFTIAGALPDLGTWTASSFLLIFAVMVPDERVPRGWRRPAFYTALFIAFVNFVLQSYRDFGTNTYVPYSVPAFSGDVFTGLITILIVARLASMATEERARFGWAAFAIIYGVAINSARSAFSNVPSLAWISSTAGDLTFLTPLCLMYAILKRHVIDVRFVISRTVVYAAVTTVIVGLIGAVDWATSAYLNQTKAAMAIDAVVTITLGFVLHRTYRWIEYAADFLLFRNKHEAERYLRRLTRTLTFANSEEAVDRALVHDPIEKLDLTAAVLYHSEDGAFVARRTEGWALGDAPRFERDDDLIRFLLTERSKIDVSDLRRYVAQPFRKHGAIPAVALPMFRGNRLIGFSLYGIHRDGTKLDPDEIEILEHLCGAASQAYTGISLSRYESILAAKPAPAGVT